MQGPPPHEAAAAQAPAKMDDTQLLSWATNLPHKLLQPEHSPALASALARWALAGASGTLGPPSLPSTFSVHVTWFYGVWEAADCPPRVASFPPRSRFSDRCHGQRPRN